PPPFQGALRRVTLCFPRPTVRDLRLRSTVMPLNHDRPFLPVNIGLLTVSDTRTEADDRSGNTLAELATAAGHRIAARRIVRDDFDAIVAQLRAWIADP